MIRNNIMAPFIVAALYQFKTLADPQSVQKSLQKLCQQHGIKGTLLLAHEGINGTVAGTRDAIDQLKSFLINQFGFTDLEYKESTAPSLPFYRLKVRLKKEIVTIGCAQADPTKQVGQYVDPAQWHELIQDPNVIVIDTRNDYEVQIGTFKGALNPHTEVFSEFPSYIEHNLKDAKGKKIAMFCTGGIRCEKASSYMKQAGFDQVYHLKGGILKYIETMPAEQSLWQGECFVFDNRVTVKHGLEIGDYELCHGCRHPLSPDDKLSSLYTAGVTCHRCYDNTTVEQKHRFAERQKQMTLAKQRGQAHIGR